MNDQKMVALTAAAAGVALFNPLGWAAFAGLQAYYWTERLLDSDTTDIQIRPMKDSDYE